MARHRAIAAAADHQRWHRDRREPGTAVEAEQAVANRAAHLAPPVPADDAAQPYHLLVRHAAQRRALTHDDVCEGARADNRVNRKQHLALDAFAQGHDIAGVGAGQEQAVNRLGPRSRKLLGDGAAVRVSQHKAAPEADLVHDTQDILRHRR